MSTNTSQKENETKIGSILRSLDCLIACIDSLHSHGFDTQYVLIIIIHSIVNHMKTESEIRSLRRSHFQAIDTSEAKHQQSISGENSLCE